MNEEKLQWITWAKEKADWYDPFIQKEDDYLGRYDSNILESAAPKNVGWNSGWGYTQ